MKKNLLTALLGMVLCGSTAIAQLPDETSGRVPELDAFHKPIYELWHTAWPAKDIARLKSLLPDVEKAYTTLAAAKLPGILRDKQAKWDEKLQVLAQSMKAYKETVEKGDGEGILKATEAVHMNYEQMVRLVRPVVKELDVFHQSLYLLHHYYMPENKTELIKAAADSLARKMAALNGAALPKRLEARTEQFKKALKNLDESVQAFSAAVKAKKGKDEIAKLENTLHARYQVVEKVFE
ncbi:MAG TPA: hypothetical protein DEP53_18870 [Bacteroidetes bacterium]|nr:hypothetical protein [Bacteroidota bacterium]